MKTCPVCQSQCFDDMDVCFGCMYRFAVDAPTPQQESASDEVRPVVEVPEEPVEVSPLEQRAALYPGYQLVIQMVPIGNEHACSCHTQERKNGTASHNAVSKGMNRMMPATW